MTTETAMRILSYYPAHRLLTGDASNGMTPFSFQLLYSSNQSFSFTQYQLPQILVVRVHELLLKSLLPLSSSVGVVETDFLNKRRLAWEDSFRILYCMLWKRGRDLFYVCTSKFVVMLIAACGTGKSKCICFSANKRFKVFVEGAWYLFLAASLLFRGGTDEQGRLGWALWDWEA